MNAQRFDDGKTEYDLLPPYPTEQVAKVFMFGAQKYAKNDWLKGMPTSKFVNAMFRHLQAFRRGEDIDPESGLPHLAHLATNAMMLMETRKQKPEMDDRSFIATHSS